MVVLRKSLAGVICKEWGPYGRRVTVTPMPWGGLGYPASCRSAVRQAQQQHMPSAASASCHKLQPDTPLVCGSVSPCVQCCVRDVTLHGCLVVWTACPVRHCQAQPQAHDYPCAEARPGDPNTPTVATSEALTTVQLPCLQQATVNHAALQDRVQQQLNASSAMRHPYTHMP